MHYNELNTSLIEHFGNLERLCNQIYGDKHGVTSYIENMERINVDNFRFHIKRLKEVRHKRNNLSHGEVSFSEPYAYEEDIKYITDFRESILNQTDPLAVYHKRTISKRIVPASTTNRTSYTTTKSNSEFTPKKSRSIPGCMVTLIIWLLIAILVVSNIK